MNNNTEEHKLNEGYDASTHSIRGDLCQRS